MGYTGRIMVGRTELPPAQSAALRAFGVDVLWHCAYQDGWWRALFDGDDGDRATATLRALVSETGRPALSAFVFDSDCAEVVGMTPGGTRWRAYLNEEKAAEYGAPPLPYSRDELVTQMLAWAAEAGLAGSAATVGDVLAENYVFAEDALAELLEALGLVRADETP